MKLTWLGHEGFRIESPGGRTILIDPWIDNPKANDAAREAAEKADLLLITHGHGDHMGSVAHIAWNTRAKVVCIHEIAVFLAGKKMDNEIIGMNKGGSVVLDGMRITMVNADHSSSIQDGETILPGGAPVGYVIRLEDGYTVYHAGDTGLFGDMALIAKLYRPNLALLPIGDRYTMGPAEAAYAVELIRPDLVVPMHYQTFPLLTGTLEDFQAALGPDWKGRVLAPVVGETVNIAPGETRAAGA